MKQCKKCGEWKNIEDFHKDKPKKDGHSSLCKKCAIARAKKWKEDNPEKNRLNGRKYVSRHRAEHNKRGREWHRKNKERSRENSKRWASVNIERKRENYKTWIKEKRATNPSYRLRHSIEVRVYDSLKGNKGGRAWEQLLGYTLEDLRNRLENQFSDGMTWDNYGKWHLDHRTPISAFNFTDASHVDFQKCWALDNLQPMWATENLRKGAKLNESFQPSLALSVEVRDE